MTGSTEGSKSATIPPQTVTRDGAITVPYAGRIQVAGKRVQDEPENRPPVLAS
jgi:polysaccharide export outer membrane protein